jgi:hypothetical protein
MRHHLTITLAALRHCLAQFATWPGRAVRLTAGVSRLPDRFELLLHTPPPEALDLPGLVDISVIPAGRASIHDALLRPDRPSALVALGGAAGEIGGVFLSSTGAVPIDSISLVGPGMPRLLADPPDGSPSAPDLEMWSRTIGALGESAWRRLRSLHFAVVGCGRSGSLAAIALARMGARRLTLVDPDTVESHNIGESAGLTLRDLASPKPLSLAALIRRETSPDALRLDALAGSVVSLSALVSLKSADFIVCCVDNAAARIAADFFAKLYLKPLVDIGTGIPSSADKGRPRRMGADIRLILPGRCLLCFGGIAGMNTAPVSDWRRQRAGSLRSLNETAVGLALRLIEEFVAGRLRDSVWLQLDTLDNGIPELRPVSVGAGQGCRICRMTGLGDDGIHRISSVVH